MYDEYGLLVGRNGDLFWLFRDGAMMPVADLSSEEWIAVLWEK